MTRTVHVIGAGLAGLAAAVRLAKAGLTVRVHEAANQAGGRCRSYHDPALDMEIDNGNHLLLSGNRAAMAYLREVDGLTRMAQETHANFAFIDLTSRERWTVRINEGRLPLWIFDAKRRVPGTGAADYLSFAPLLWARRGTVGDAIACRGALYDRLVQPLLIAALNTAAEDGDATLAGAIIRETLGAGGAACHPLIASDGLGAAFVTPALETLARHGATVSLGRRVRSLEFADGHVEAVSFGEDSIALDPGDAVVLAAPAVVAKDLVPGLEGPDEFRAIVNAHFKIAPPAGQPLLIGLINATAEWIFAFPDRLSTTTSAADRLLDAPREDLARQIWSEVAAVTGLPDDLPPWQIVRERRATFAATPAQNAKRPGPRTRWDNLLIAGDWTDTGLPATIEGAIRSGHRAAELVQTL